MSEKSYFLDSNIWLYALLDAPDSDRKRRLAISLINTEQKVVVSTQVINEVSINLLKKSSLSEDQIKSLVQAFYDGCTVIQLNHTILMSAPDLRIQYRFSFWDSLIVASALHADINVLYSEDMQDGLVVSEKLEIVNPFK